MPSHRFKHHITPTGLCNWAIAHLEHVPWALKSASLEKESPDVTITRWWFQRFFSPRKLGKMNPFWLILFNWGWFNHQLVNVGMLDPPVSPPIFMESQVKISKVKTRDEPWTFDDDVRQLLIFSITCWSLNSGEKTTWDVSSPMNTGIFAKKNWAGFLNHQQELGKNLERYLKGLPSKLPEQHSGFHVKIFMQKFVKWYMEEFLHNLVSIKPCETR